jgi:branched-chain amino acid transport system permease protein
MSLVRLVRDRDVARGGYAALIAGAIVVGACAALVGLILPLALGAQYQTLVVATGVAAVMTVGYQIFVGNTGIVSFGHPAFVAIGAYASGIVLLPGPLKAVNLPDLPPFLAGIELGFLPALLVGGLVAAVFALAIGPIVLRLSGATAGIMTFGILVIVNEVLRNATAITRGTQTFFGVPAHATFAAVYGILAVAIVVAVAFKFSPAGLRARTVREDPLAAETLGMSVVAGRLWPWVLSAFVMGVSGGLWGSMLTAFSPKSFYVELVIPMMAMAVLGGTHSVLGVVLGTAAITAWGQLMRFVEASGLGFPVPIGLSQLTLGVGLVLILYFRPTGLLGSLDLEAGPTRGGSRRDL